MSSLQRFLVKFSVLAAMLLGLPLIGVFVAGFPVTRYLEFPPQSRYVQQAPFSWPAFFVIVFLIIASVLPPTIKGIQSYRKTPHPAATPTAGPFPWWGWIGIFTGMIAWILAWTRFAWFAEFQAHTFSPLWFSYILVINALCLRRTGRCLMTERPGFFLLLFPASAAFWWFFEYLNRFVQNWYYVGVQFSPWAYFWYATLPFSTVLPSVLSTRQFLLGAGWISRGYARTRPIALWHPVPAATGCLVLSAAGLAGIGVWPNYLFPFLWISPLLIIIGLQTLMKERHLFWQTAAGDWRGTVAAVLAAIICGGFWEMWNYLSLAKWEYSIPLVQRLHIFEMPLLGYAGYLPFGLACAVIGDMLGTLFKKGSGLEASEVQG
jgi:hypothetical protein